MFASGSRAVSVSSADVGFKGGLGVRPLVTDRAMASRITKRLFEHYDRDHNGTIDEHETTDLISDAYKTINKTAKVDREDSKLMVEVMDCDKDGRVTQFDVERLVQRYLCGN